MNKKIDENLDPEKRWYPAITRLLISLIGIYEPEPNEELDSIEIVFKRKFLDRLKRNYPKLARADPDFARDLLPKNVTYDGMKNEISRIGIRENVTVLKLNPLDNNY